MPTFQTIVLVIAIVILILVLVLIGFALNKASMSNWPPLIGECPDYWTDMSGNGSMCANVMNLGNEQCVTPANGKDYFTMDFTNSSFLGGNGMCAKYQWARNCGVEWDGITSGVSNPCDAPGNSLSK